MEKHCKTMTNVKLKKLKNGFRRVALLGIVEKLMQTECHSESAEGETKNLHINQYARNELPQNDRVFFSTPLFSVAGGFG